MLRNTKSSCLSDEITAAVGGFHFTETGRLRFHLCLGIDFSFCASKIFHFKRNRSGLRNFFPDRTCSCFVYRFMGHRHWREILCEAHTICRGDLGRPRGRMLRVHVGSGKSVRWYRAVGAFPPPYWVLRRRGMREILRMSCLHAAMRKRLKYPRCCGIMCFKFLL